jgi:hypothetical protein
MNKRSLMILFAAIFFFGPSQKNWGEEAKISFTQEIRPILSRHCYACHGPDQAQRKGKLRLDTKDGAFSDRGGWAPVVAGHVAKSGILERITSTDKEEVMPPGGAEKRLSSEEVTKLTKWIEQGAPWADHWAFTRLENPKLPTIKDESWVSSPLDYFVLAKLEAMGLKPNPPADKQSLIRRVSLDLTGLPPTQDMVREFLNDTAPDAYARLVERLLASPAYGERWARIWLDLARFADTKGYEKDRSRPMWRYRDWVIAAFNRDMPYDQFSREQLAGDLLPGNTPSQRLATAFHRNTLTNEEGGTDDEEFRIAAVKDRIDTTMQVWMGLTFGCAKCHSHKYDPISMTDYYRFYAIFNQTADSDRGDESPFESFPTDADQIELKAIEFNLTELNDKLKYGPPQKSLFDSIKSAKDRQIAILTATRTPIFQEMPADKQRKTRMHQRGNFLDPGAEVEPGTPDSFPRLSGPVNRLTITGWFFQPDNPLTARVAVNRHWSAFFGEGIVPTQEDFGSQGQPPSNQPMLDYLSVAFRDSGWSFKALCRLIVNSSTYRQSTAAAPEKIAKDPNNRQLSRFPRTRLEAEMIRDSALRVSGLLSSKMFGPSVMPYQPEGIWRSTYNTDKWQTSPGEDKHRRSLYTFVKRTSPYPAMITLDAPSREFCNIRRLQTNTPLQALVTLNDAVYVEAAQALARRMVSESEKTDAPSRIALGMQMALFRPANTSEIAALTALYDEQLKYYQQNQNEAEKMSTKPLGPLPPTQKAPEMAALTNVANVILNLDEFLTKP